jgi:hypothetical protein
VKARELADDELANVTHAAFQLLGRCVVPLYVDADGTPCHIGTGFFLALPGGCLLVSAAHVLDEGRDRGMYFYSSPNTKRLVFGRLTMSRHDGPRTNDMVDLGAVLLEGPALPPYPGIEKHPLPLSCIEAGLRPSSSARYGLVGFPASRTRVRHAPAEVRVEGHAYHAESAPSATYHDVGLSTESHICLMFDRKKSYGLDGKGRSFPMPHGISGSPIFLLHDLEEMQPSGKFLLAGVVTAWDPKRKLLIGPGPKPLSELTRVAA